MIDVRTELETGYGITRGNAETDPPVFNLGIGANTTKLNETELESLLKLVDTATAVVTGITAGTTQTQAGATVLTGKVNILGTVANANDGVVLPTAVAGTRIVVINRGANIARIYPAASDTIDGGSANSPITIPVGGSYEFFAESAVNWKAQKTALQLDWGIGTLDGSNPTPVTHRLNQIVAGFVQQIGSASPGLDPTKLTAAISSNTFNVHAWKPTSASDCTLIASTNNTITFFWLAVGY